MWCFISLHNSFVVFGTFRLRKKLIFKSYNSVILFSKHFTYVQNKQIYSVKNNIKNKGVAYG